MVTARLRELLIVLIAATALAGCGDVVAEPVGDGAGRPSQARGKGTPATAERAPGGRRSPR